MVMTRRNNTKILTWGYPLIFILALLFSLFVNNAMPFISMPTLGQAVWTTGFSLSFINESIFSIYAHNFGAPEPAAISFGLAGAWPSAVFIKSGLHPADAYSLMVAFWLSVSFGSAFGIGRYFSVPPLLSILGAVGWLTMPVIWAHAGYSMLSIGIALLPFYFLGAIHLFSLGEPKGLPEKSNAAKWLACYLAVCLISVFMDGYSFMMFAVGSTLLGVWHFANTAENRRRVLLFSFPVHIMGLGAAYMLYALYIGKLQYDAAPIDFFRAWGMDLTFLLIPTQGIHWLPDLIGWSVSRSEDIFFGDKSVWTTTFSIPVFAASTWAAVYASHRWKILLGFAAVMTFGLYMALGPSLKVNSVKPYGIETGNIMTAEYAVAPTGSALLSGYLPGFKNMRASYRWIALALFAAWVLIVLAMSIENKRSIITAAAIALGLITIFNLPGLPGHLKEGRHNREMFLRLDSDLVKDMEKLLQPGEKAAFLPWGNDFLANYLASRLNFITYNIGGDKNLAAAWPHWPKTMRRFPAERVDDHFADRSLLLLARNEAEILILPYFDMLWSAHEWPYPLELNDQLAPVLAGLEKSGFVSLENRDYYAAVRLKSQFRSAAARRTIESMTIGSAK